MPSADIEKNIRVSQLYDIYGNLLSDRQREIVSLYYNDDLSLGEIAELTGLTRQGVRDSVIKGVAFLEEYEKKLGFIQEFINQKEKIKIIVEELEKVQINTGYDISFLISELNTFVK